MIVHSKPSIGARETEAVAAVLNSGRIAQGAQVERFEQACAQFIQRRYAVAVSSGTAALHLALGALGVRPDEPVAAPSYSCAALITAVTMHGAAPCLCDIGDDYNIQPAAAPAGCRVAIVPSLFGAPAKLPMCPAPIEDVAQAFGGPAGKASRVAVTSFYATKLMTTGEGGMLFTDDASIAEYARDRRDYDNRDDFKSRYAYKMTDFQAAMGLVQLSRLPEFIARRREIAGFYSERLRDLPLSLPSHPNHVFFRYVIAADQRDDMETWLNERGIEAKRPVYRPAHHYLGGTYPNSQRAHEQCLSLPVYPELSDSEAETVVNGIIEFWERRREVCGSRSTGRGRTLQSA